MRIPLLALVLQGIPESIAVTTLAFVIAKVPLRWKKIVLISLIISFSAYILRLFPITFGIHTIFLMGLQFILLIQLCKVSVIVALKASLISELVLIIVESVCISSLMFLTKRTFEMVFNDISVRILFTLPQVFILFLLALIIYQIENSERIKIRAGRKIQ